MILSLTFLMYSGIFDSSIGYGGVGGAAAAATGGAASEAEGGAISDLIFGAAAGGVWGPSGRINYRAAGGIFSGPTAFMDAGGGSNVAGEAGPEAAIPLTVLPDGRAVACLLAADGTLPPGEISSQPSAHPLPPPRPNPSAPAPD